MKLLTKLPIEECRNRLTSALNGYQSMQGKLQADNFRIQKRIYYSNPGRPCFRGKLISCESGTLVEGNFDITKYFKIYAICCLSFVALWLICFICLIASGRIETKILWDKGLIQVILLLIACSPLLIIAVKILRWMDRGHKRQMVDFLKKTLDATEESAGLNSA